MSVSLTLLQSYYPVVKSLHAYLNDIIQSPEEAILIRDSDSESYKSLLLLSYVAKDRPVVQNVYQAYCPMVYMREVIDRAQERLFARSKGKPSNIITAGYRSASRNGEGGKAGGGRLGIWNYFVNTNITALQAPEWERLLERIGDDAVLHLLLETSIFVALPNDCLCQLIGDPIVHMKRPDFGILQMNSARQREKRPAPPSHPDEPPAKRLRLKKSTSRKSKASIPPSTTTDFTEKRSPVDISFVRVRLFYSRPFYVPHGAGIAVGLPPKHILNRLHPSYHRKPKIPPEEYVDPDPRKQMEDTRHLAKYVFPRQFGLSSPFSFDGQQKTQSYQLPDFGDREEEIKKRGPCKTPKRVKTALELLEKLIWRHGKCGYKPLRDKACPSRLKSVASTPIDSSVILELMSETLPPLYSQGNVSGGDTSIDSEGRTIIARGLSQAEKHAKGKPRFAEFACSHVQVYCYAVLVTKAVIPKALWGCHANFQLILKYIKEFISCRRYETLSLHHVLQGFSTAECDWLMPPTPSAKRQARVCISDALKRRELLEEFLFWYFDSFLLPLLRTTFYVTESSAFRNQVLYFRQDDWRTLCEPLIERLACDTFQKMDKAEAEELLRQRKLGFSFVRLLPKDTGVRPIVNLRRRNPQQKSLYRQPDRSINQILQAAFQILTYEKEVQPDLLGASVFGPNEVYRKLKAFKSRLKSENPGETLPKLYFVKVDVQACFDTIEQTKLLGILREILTEDAYMGLRYGQVSSAAGKIKRRYMKKALPEDDHPHFLTFARELASALKQTIFVDQVVYPFSKREEIIELLEEHITENIVKIGSDYYRQMVGIPQGSVLSALLCSFFYGDLERRKFKFTEDPQSLLMRLIDDYLLVTTNPSTARRFLDMMNQGHPEYGCFITKEKTMTNFNYDAQIMNVTSPHQRSFPWCGYVIDMKDLSVSTDYERYNQSYLADSLTVERGRRPGVAFAHKMLQLAKHKSHILFCDTDLNSEHSVYLNIYQTFLVAGMKMHHYLRSWGINIGQSTPFIRNTIRQMITFTFATIRNKASNKVARASNGRCDVEKSSVCWLGMHAFHTVLTRKPHAYLKLIKSFEFDLSLPQYRRCRRRFRNVVKDGLGLMTVLGY